MTTVTGRLIGAANPQRVEMVAALVDVTGKAAVGYVASVPGELVKPVPITPASDGSWTVALTANSLIESQAGDTLWAIQEGRAKDGSPIVTYVAVPASGGPFWAGAIRADLSSTQTGQGTVVYLPGPEGPAGPPGAAGTPGTPGTNGTDGADGSDGAPGTAGQSAYQVAVAAGFSGTEAEWLASLTGPVGDTGPEGPQPPLGAAGAGADVALRSTDPTTTNPRTPTAHATSHQAGGSDELALTQAQITGLTTALAALLPKAGGTLTGSLILDGHDLTVQRADGEGAYRFRVTGGGLDLEVGGMDVTVSVWSGPAFDGTQTDVMRWEPAGPHLIGKTQFGTNPFDDVHEIDAGTGVASLGAKNGSLNLRFCGRRTTAGAPTTGAWLAGDLVQDAEAVWWLCTADGTPGTWTSGAAPKPWVFDITKYGAVGDAKIVTDGAVIGGVAALTCTTSAPFSSSLVGKPVLIQGAGPAGVTAFATTFASYNSPTSMNLTAAPPTTISGATVVFGTNSYTAVRAATAAAEAYLAAGHPYAEVYTPPVGGYVIDGPLDTSKSGNGNVVFGAYPTTGGKKALNFRTDGSGAGVRHWEQLVPQISGGTWISFGFYSSTSAQTADLNANGHPGVISGPNEGTSNGLAYGASARFSNIQPMIENMAFLVPHTQYGITRGAWNFYGCANAHVRNVSVSTLGVVPGSDYSSPGTFATGLAVAALMPAPGNNDLSVIENLSIQGGFTYGLLFSEHTIIDRIMVLYCWAALCPVGNYAGSVGSVHEMVVLSASVEACAHELYVMGVGSEGVGPTVDIHLSTESSTPNVDGNSTGALMAALGTLKLTGLFTPSGVHTAAPTGIEIINGQVPRAIALKTGSFTASPLDRTLICDTTAGAFTATLPNADVNPVQYTFRNVGANDLTIDPAGAQTIDGAATLTVPHGQTVQIQALYNGTAWGWYSTVQPSVALTGDQVVAGNKTFSWYTVLEGGQVNGEFHALGTAGFFGATPAGRQTVTGAKGGNAALASLITALANLGLITDSTT